MSNLHNKPEESLSQIKQVFSKFDTRRLRIGILMDDAISEVAWDNGFKIPFAPIKGKEKLYLIGS